VRAWMRYEMGKAYGVEEGMRRSFGERSLPNAKHVIVRETFRIQQPEQQRFMGKLDAVVRGDADVPQPGFRPRAGAPEKAEESRRQPLEPAEQKVSDRLVDFVRSNKDTLRQALAAEANNPALQEFARILEALDQEEAQEAEYDLEAKAAEGADGAYWAEAEGDERAWSRESGWAGRESYIVQEGDTLESIAYALYLDERVSLLIHAINQEILPSAYFDDRIILKLDAGTELGLPTEDEVADFHMQLMTLRLPTFEYATEGSDAEAELNAWLRNQSAVYNSVNPYAEASTDEIEGVFRSLQEAAEDEDALSTPAPDA